MEIYLRRRTEIPEERLPFITRLKLIIDSITALARHAYDQGGAILVIKDIISVILNLNIVLFMTRPDARHLLKYHPDLLNGSLSHPYLATSFNNSRKTRYNILMSHYTFMASRLKATFYKEVRDHNLVLWSAVIDSELLSICLEFERKHRHEGDLTLSFEVNSISVYQVCFTIAPGFLFGCSAPFVLFIARVQGFRERYEEIRRATKSCKDIAPVHLLVVAAQAIAVELGIGVVVGVNNKEQLSKTQEGGFPFPFDYDSFWKACSATSTARDFYEFPATYAGKPLERVSSDHRRRARLKRQFKTKVNESIRVEFAEKCLEVRLKTQPKTAFD